MLRKMTFLTLARKMRRPGRERVLDRRSFPGEALSPEQPGECEAAQAERAVPQEVPSSLVREPILKVDGGHWHPQDSLAFREGFVEVQEHVADDRPGRRIEGIHPGR